MHSGRYGEAECAKISTQDHSKNHYRYTEIMKTKSKTGNSEVWLDVRGESQEQALYNVLLSLFIVVLLLWWTFIFRCATTRCNGSWCGQHVSHPQKAPNVLS